MNLAVPVARWKIIIAALLLAAAIVVVLQNTEEVDAKILFVTLTMPRSVLLGATFLSGACAGLLVASRFLGKKASAK